MGKRLHGQAERFHEAFVELVRRYQFRDRDAIGCHGVSVSQCYALDALWRSGSLTMGELAAELSLEISTMTRIVDHLVEAKLADRREDPNDRRVRRVCITRKGRGQAGRIQGELVAEYEQVLGEIPAEHREAVITAIQQLLSAFEQRQQQTSPAGPSAGAS